MAYHILIVDDSETVLMFEKMMLTGTAYRVETARNGRQALEALAAAQPDLILLDIQMPELDGIETCRRIKANPAHKDIPVIMVTTRGEPEKVEEAFMAGCDDYLTKPLNKVDLMTKLRTHLR